MTCPSGFEFLHRPYPYAREPFRLGSGEIVGYEGRYFSIPAFGLLLDKRLFTEASSHPVATPITLYINRDAGLSQSIEPSLNASGYEVATPHYADYIIDMRNLLEDVFSLHSADSQYSSDEFFATHMRRNRAIYDIPNSSASGVSDLVFVHPESANTVPVAPSSLLTPGNEIELGAQQFQDIDLDEVMWQPFTRPKLEVLGSTSVPFEPIFPAALPDGDVPTFTTLDEEKYGELALNIAAAASGGVLLTGDNLTEGTSLKLLTGSGEIGASEGSFRKIIPWAQFPAGDELNLYYPTESSGCISASGRQALYDVPAGLTDNKVYLLDVSDVGTSGELLQTFPANYHATSGIDENGTAHPGVHTVDRLLYGLGEFGANNLAAGRSLINGKKVFGHFVGSEVSPKGVSIASAFKYVNGDTVYGYGGINTPFATSTTASLDWATFDNTLSPLSWGQTFSSAVEPRAGIFGGPSATTWDVGDIMAAGDGVIWFKRYTGWGTMDRLVCPASDRAGGGDKRTGTIVYETHLFREGTDPLTGNFVWIELDPPESPVFTSNNIRYFADTYTIGNIMTFFFYRNLNFGFVNVNDETRIQWSQIGALGIHVKPRYNQFAPVSSLTRSSTLAPPTSHSSAVNVVGFFPSWKLQLSVTTNNQITIPDSIPLSPAGGDSISFAADIPMSLNRVDSFGPAVWDSTTGLNYLYFVDILGDVFFAKMNTSFVITHINRVSVTDAILAGRAAILSI
ncbi:MAG: hypothetical protein V3T23_01615 [Nitrososphaerales archaeon]